jgi:hypothetical protein
LVEDSRKELQVV